MDVVAHVVKAEGVGRVTRDGFGAGLPASCVVGERLWRGIAPREIILLDTAAGGEFPFGFGRQAVGAGCLRSEPFAVAGGFVPGDSGDRLLGMIEVSVLPEWRRWIVGCGQEFRVFGIGELRGGGWKTVDQTRAGMEAFQVLAGVEAIRTRRPWVVIRVGPSARAVGFESAVVSVMAVAASSVQG